MAAWKHEGKGLCTQLVVTGCLPQRYGNALEEALPEVDLFLGIAEIPTSAAISTGCYADHTGHVPSSASQLS